MTLQLPVAQPGRLPRSPLSLVSCQLKLEDVEPVTSAQLIAIREEMAAANFAYPGTAKMQVASVSIELGSGGPAQGQAPSHSGWRLQSADGRWIATLVADSVALETTKYDGWNVDFKDRFAALVRAVAAHSKPAAETRLGLRYVDLFTQPDAAMPADWTRYLSESFLGPIRHPTIGAGVTATQQQVSLQLDDSVKAVVRHGAFSDPAHDGRSTYLLDTDVFRDALRAFDVASILETAERFHDLALRLFQQIITPAMLDFLRSEE